MNKLKKFFFSCEKKQTNFGLVKIYTIFGIKIKKTYYKNDHLILRLIDSINNLIDIEIGKYPKLKILSKSETLDILSSTEKSIARFGDGEITLALAKNSIGFQEYDLNLAKRLLEVLCCDEENLFIGLYKQYGSQTNDEVLPDVETAEFWRQHKRNVMGDLIQYLDPNKTYANTGISRNGSKEMINKWKKIWDNKRVVVVEGELTRAGVGNDLFDNVESIERILCPAENSFDKYSEILEECKKQPKDKLFLLMLGPTATVLAYDLYKLGYRAIDVGHVDLCYEWRKTGRKGKFIVPYKYTNEVEGGNIVADCNDETYLKSIITKI